MTTEDRDFAKKITTYLDRGAAELKSGTAYRLQLARTEALARLADPAPGGAVATGAFRRRHGVDRRPLWVPRRHPLLGRYPAHRRGAVRLPAMAGLSATAGHRGDGCRDPVLGPAHRRVPGPGIPELAEARIATTTDRILAVSLALAGMAGGAVAQPVALPSPAWSELSGLRAPDACADRVRVGQARRAAQAEMARPRAALSEDDRRMSSSGSGSRWARGFSSRPQQRAAAREQYKTIKQLPPEQKQDVRQKWERYQSLPPETRQDLATKPPVRARPRPIATSAPRRRRPHRLKPHPASAPMPPGNRRLSPLGVSVTCA